MSQLTKKIISVVLLVLVVFIGSGLGVLSQPKVAKATWPTIDIAKIANDVLVAIWKFAIFPLIKKLVLKLASGDLSLNGLEILNWAVNDLWFQSMQAILYNFTGVSLCADIKMNIRVAFAQAGAPGTYIPECTFDRSLIKKGLDTLQQLQKEGLTGTEKWKIFEREFTQRFGASLEGSNNDYTTWFGLRSNAIEQMAKKEQNYRFELLVNQGFFGARDCQNIKPDTKTAAAEAAGGKANANTAKDAAATAGAAAAGGAAGATGAKTVDKYRDCRIKSPGLMFAEEAKQNISGLKQGSLEATAIQDMIALTGLTIDTIIQTTLTGFWNQLTNTGSTGQSLPSGTNYQSSGQNRTIEIPKEEKLP